MTPTEAIPILEAIIKERKCDCIRCIKCIPALKRAIVACKLSGCGCGLCYIHGFACNRYDEFKPDNDEIDDLAEKIAFRENILKDE